MPYEPFLDAARALRYDVDVLAARFGGLIRAGLPPALAPCSGVGARRRAVLLPARRPGRQCLASAFPPPAFPSCGSAAPARAGSSIRPLATPGTTACRSRSSRTRRPSSASPAPSAAGRRAGATRRRCGSSPWGATSAHAAELGLWRRAQPRHRRRRHRPVLPALRTARIAAPAPSPPIAHRLTMTRKPPAPARIGSRPREGKGERSPTFREQKVVCLLVWPVPPERLRPS